MLAFARPLAFAGVAVLAATGTFAQSGPNPFSTVPGARTAYAAVHADLDDRVFGGAAVAEGEYPFQVALARADSLNDTPISQYEATFCGGSLIAPNWVLTAAHCVTDWGDVIAPEWIKVLAGSTDLTAASRVDVAAVYPHEDYDEYTLDNDIALIELATPVAYTPVALDFDAGSAGEAVVIGWGRTEAGDYPRELLKSDIDVVDNGECNAGIKVIYSRAVREAIAEIGGTYGVPAAETDRLGEQLAASIADPLTERMLCAGIKSGGRDACYGDSGGPLVANVDGRPVQLGVVSWGEGPADADIKCGHADVYGVYARVSSYAGWIAARIGSGQ